MKIINWLTKEERQEVYKNAFTIKKEFEEHCKENNINSDYTLFNNKPLIEKMFYYVFVPWNGEPKERHYWLKSAKIEAQRLARKTWKEVQILQAMKSYKVNEIIETNFQNIN